MVYIHAGGHGYAPSGPFPARQGGHVLGARCHGRWRWVTGSVSASAHPTLCIEADSESVRSALDTVMRGHAGRTL